MIEALLGAGLLPLTLTGAAFLAVAAWIFALGVGDRASRAFAALLAFLGLSTLITVMTAARPDPGLGLYLTSVLPYAIIPTAFYLVAFLSLFPRRRGPLGRSRVAMGAFIALGVGLCAWYLFDHSAYATVGPADGQPATAGGDFRFTGYGPLAVFLGIRRPLLALAAVVLARDYWKDPHGSGGFSTFLMFAGFAINAVFDGVTFTTGLVQDVAERGSDLWQPGAWMQFGLPALTLPIAAVALAYIGLALRHERGDATLQEARRFLTYALPAVALSGFAISFRPWGPWMADATPFLIGTWRLAVPLLLAYGLLRYSLFSLDIGLKHSVRRGIAVAIFTVTFFAVSEAAEGIVQGDRGPLFGIASAGLLALASRPVQGLAGRAADRLMPDTKPIAEQSHAERMRFYLDQHQLIRQDGEVTPKERAMLERLRRTLSLSTEVAMDLEAGAVVPEEDAAAQAPALADGAPKDTKLEIAVRGALAAAVLALFFGMLSQGIESALPLSNQAAGLLAAAAVALSLGPLEALADRLTHRIDPRRATDARDEAERRQAFRAALAEALRDGSLSDRDLVYLASLQQRLRISGAARWRLERSVRRQMAP